MFITESPIRRQSAARAAFSADARRPRRRKRVPRQATSPGQGAMKAVAVTALLACLTAGCSALPTAGPTASDVRNQEVRGNQTRFDLVDIDDNVVSVLAAAPGESFRARFK